MSKSRVARYSKDAKQEARDAIWTEGAKAYARSPGDVLMLGGSTPLEIATAIRHGIPAERIVVVEKNAANRAHITRRMTPQLVSKVRMFTDDVVEASSKSLLPHSIVFAHLDFCGTVSTIKGQVSNFCLSGALDKNAVLAVTVLSGRERNSHLPRKVKDWSVSKGELLGLRRRLRLLNKLDVLTDRDHLRIGKLLRVSSPWSRRWLDVRRLRVCGKYVGAKVPMLWLVIDCSRQMHNTVERRKSVGMQMRKLWGDQMFRTKMSKILSKKAKTRWRNPVFRANMRESIRKFWNDSRSLSLRVKLSLRMRAEAQKPNGKSKRLDGIKRLWRDPTRSKEIRAKFSAAMRKRWNDDPKRFAYRAKHRARQSILMKKRWCDPAMRIAIGEKISKAQKKNWNDPKSRALRLEKLRLTRINRKTA